jgi:hypothetical protein
MHDFVGGVAALLSPSGRATFEFPHLLRLMDEVQFDTIYHEHFSYLSMLALEPVFAGHGLTVVDVESLPTHGGSLRVFVAHAGQTDGPDASDRVDAVIASERLAGLATIETYLSFQSIVEEHRDRIVAFLTDLHDRGNRVAGYGAPAKANTMLNYCRIGPDLIDFTVDASPLKQGTLLPGSHIPVLTPAALEERRPEVVVLLPWNLREELTALLVSVRTWGGSLAVCRPIPELLP